MAQQVEVESRARVAIVGPVNSGKSTLFNTLNGHEISPVGAIPGTTRDLQHEQWGPFTLTDTPGFGEVNGVDRAGIALQGVRNASAVVLVLDAVAGVRQSDYALLQKLKATGKPVLVVLNKIDLLKKDVAEVVDDACAKLGEPGLIPNLGQARDKCCSPPAFPPDRCSSRTRRRPWSGAAGLSSYGGSQSDSQRSCAERSCWCGTNPRDRYSLLDGDTSAHGISDSSYLWRIDHASAG